MAVEEVYTVIAYQLIHNEILDFAQCLESQDMALL